MLTLQSVFDAFILSRKLANLSFKTIECYTSFIMPFVFFVGSFADFSKITQENINAYLLLLLERPLSKSTLATYIRHLKVFLKWSSVEFIASFDYRKIKVPKSPRRFVKIYSDSEIRFIFETVSLRPGWLAYRNCAIISLMLDSGLRQSEVCSILKKNISFEENRLLVCGKGNKERTVPLGYISIKYLRLYFLNCPFSDDNFVFFAQSGALLSCNAVKLFISKLAKQLPFDFSSHKLRHNFATNYCLDQYFKFGQIDIYRLMYLMGHADVDTTRRYLHFAYEIIASKNCISHVDKCFNFNDI